MIQNIEWDDELNTGDVLFQLIGFNLIIGLVTAVFYTVRSLVMKNNSDNSKSIEHTLDRIIELLEKNNKD